ncbi:hypothetical protein [Paenisporosarcina cavernae]|uniref:AraC family transcriptional regulator n=1 Tax=Paenisporosarcina cavernae TaxID=2320858 RepID=A0A385YUJ2_9BACL|nr:hypothetical protein [Paenisporosarcina cavernae]AYC30141.1 hypothetical protein D3873_09745 [Paenisporosarcina cavernae]
MNKKWTIKEINEYVKKNSDSVLLTKEYTGFSQKLLFKCSCGNNFERTFKKFKDNKQTKCTSCVEIKPSR